MKTEVKIDTDIDFLFFTYIKVEHRKLDDERKTIQNYPNPQEIAEEMIRSGYKTYFEQNIASEITTFEDEKIKAILK